jgi:hypothetical protein
VFYILILPTYVPTSVNYILLIICGVFSIIIGFFAAMWVRLGLFLVGAWIGVLSGLMVFNSVIAPSLGGEDPKAALYLTVFLFIIVIGTITMYLFDHAVIVGSAFCGAYALVRVSSTFIH